MPKTSFKGFFCPVGKSVFGKIGSQLLGKSAIEQYAAAFGFITPLIFEAPIDSSTLSVDDVPSSVGRNCLRLQSHHHDIAPSRCAHRAAILNQGAMIEPTMIDHIADQTGHLIYQSRVEPMKQVISAKSSDIMARMMEATVNSGPEEKLSRVIKKIASWPGWILAEKPGLWTTRHMKRIMIGLSDLL